MDWLQMPIVRGAITGALAAAGADYMAFRSWKSWHDIVTYSWSTALFRWIQGAVTGALASLGLGVVA